MSGPATAVDPLIAVLRRVRSGCVVGSEGCLSDKADQAGCSLETVGAVA